MALVFRLMAGGQGTNSTDQASNDTLHRGPTLQPTGLIDFAYLRNRAGSVEGGRALFEDMVVQLVGIDYPQVQNLRPMPGDWGMDGLVGELDDVVAVWQAKYFIDKFDQTQKTQITKSLGTMVKKADENGYVVRAWTLCIPIDLEPSAMQWWARLRRKMRRTHGVACELWSSTQLKRRLLREPAEGVRRYFFPTVHDRPRLRDIQSLPDSSVYENSLFVAQLQAGDISQVETAKLEFFNAEILERDVYAKKDDSELGELLATRATVHSLWAHRYDAACSKTDGNQLPGLHGNTMAAIEHSYNAHPPTFLRSRSVHHFGIAHQLCDNGKLGWVRNFEEIVASYGF